MGRRKQQGADGAPRSYPWQSATKFALQGCFGFLRLLGPVRASNLAGSIAAAIGPHLGQSKVADRNLSRAMPELSAEERKRIVVEVCGAERARYQFEADRTRPPRPQTSPTHSA